MNDQVLKPKDINFYVEVISHLLKSGIPYMIGGTFAFSHYTGIIRKTKDIDIFCKAGDYPRILTYFSKKGFKTEVADERWIAKIKMYGHLADVIFGVVNGVWSVDDSWVAHSRPGFILGKHVKLLPPEELLWSKVFRNDRNRSDIADVHHLILKQGSRFDWKRLLTRMEQHWEVLFSVLLMFRFIYPSERGIVPKWLMEELSSRLKHQLTAPISKERICRGQLFSPYDFEVDIKDWKFANISYY